ncbi:MAG: ribonuclease HI [Anaerolineales bacterium]|nr:ribonuclease HI [Anaerolineales bacterium]
MTKKERPHITIYTDGACLNNPGPGGWAALIRIGRRTQELSGAEKNTTNNRMELTAALRALQSLKTPSKVDFYTDSTYLKRGITEWMPNWRKRNWRRKGGKLANVDLWKALDSVIQTHDIRWHWVRGHAGNKNNERVDRLARRAMKVYLKDMHS